MDEAQTVIRQAAADDLNEFLSDWESIGGNGGIFRLDAPFATLH
ncbi:hypothetical protein [Brevundimonas sp.]|nr:hypothetical protein [Brevundimonas sp.]